jgi:hypothetical protein
VDAVALVSFCLEPVVGDLPLGLQNLGAIARQLEERGRLEIERLLPQ